MFWDVTSCLIIAVGILLFFILVRTLFDRLEELAQQRDVELMEHITEAIQPAVRAAKLVAQHQELLNDKMNALSNLVDQHSTSVVFQQNQFDMLAKSDLNLSRRNELMRSKELLAALDRLVGITTMQRQPPLGSDVEAMDTLRNRILELEEILERE